MMHLVALITIVILYVIPLNIIIYKVMGKSNLLYSLITLIIFFVILLILHVINRMYYLKYDKEINIYIKKYNKGQGNLNILVSIIIIVLTIIHHLILVGDIRIDILGILILFYVFSSPYVKKYTRKNKIEVVDNNIKNEKEQSENKIDRYEDEKRIENLDIIDQDVKNKENYKNEYDEADVSDELEKHFNSTAKEENKFDG